jgi:hypothetical protein
MEANILPVSVSEKSWDPYFPILYMLRQSLIFWTFKDSQPEFVNV